MQTSQPQPSMPMKRAIVWSALMTTGFGIVQLVAILLRS